MKKFKVLLSLLCVFSLVLCNISTSVTAANYITPANDDEMRYYPFVHSEDEGFAWRADFIGDCSDCVPGYLYVQDLSTHETWQVIDQPVDIFRSSGETLYCIVDGSSIVQTNYWGQNPTTLYTARYGTIANIELENGHLYFSDGDHVTCLDLQDRTATELAFCEGISFLFPVSETSFAWASGSGETYIHDIITGTEEVVEIQDILSEKKSSDAYPQNIQRSISVAATAQESFPLSNYPSGSYFTKTGAPCTDHATCTYDGKCNCILYAGSTQCMGFAKYAFNQYGHTSGWSYPSGNSHVIMNVSIATANDMKLFLSSLEFGSCLRLMRKGQASNPNGHHSIIVAAYNRDSITIYDCNETGPCRVSYRTVTYEDFVKTFYQVVHSVSHDFSGTITKYNSTYHKVSCSYSGCSGYILMPHYAQTPGTNVTCLACGYRGNISIGITSAGDVDS